MATPPQLPRRRFRLSLSHWILAGLVLGAFCGLFFGESCRHLQVFGDGFIALLQMTILPFIVVSLIGNIGALRPPQARILAAHAGIVQAVFWAIAAVFICLLPLGFMK